MTFDLWPKIIELPSKLAEAALTALVVREILRQVDHSAHATRQVVKRIRKRISRYKILRKEAKIFLDSMLDRGVPLSRLLEDAVADAAAWPRGDVIHDFCMAMKHVGARRRKLAILRRCLGAAG